jgi:hypothetical protein
MRSIIITFKELPNCQGITQQNQIKNLSNSFLFFPKTGQTDFIENISQSIIEINQINLKNNNLPLFIFINDGHFSRLKEKLNSNFIIEDVDLKFLPDIIFKDENDENHKLLKSLIEENRDQNKASIRYHEIKLRQKSSSVSEEISKPKKNTKPKSKPKKKSKAKIQQGQSAEPEESLKPIKKKPISKPKKKSKAKIQQEPSAKPDKKPKRKKKLSQQITLPDINPDLLKIKYRSRETESIKNLLSKKNFLNNISKNIFLGFIEFEIKEFSFTFISKNVNFYTFQGINKKKGDVAYPLFENDKIIDPWLRIIRRWLDIIPQNIDKNAVIIFIYLLDEERISYINSKFFDKKLKNATKNKVFLENLKEIKTLRKKEIKTSKKKESTNDKYKFSTVKNKILKNEEKTIFSEFNDFFSLL